MKYDFLISKLKQLVASERKITADIIELIKEIDQKRAYLEYGHTSIFALLTKDLGYTPAAAMRRIDTARLCKEIPEIKESLKTGEINLSQVSMLAQAVRQKKKKVSKDQVSKETKIFLLEQVKSLDLIATQKTLATHLDLEVKNNEKKTYQKDESLRVEITLTKDLQQNLERVKELISHQNPNPTMAELIQFLTTQFLDKKDPLRKRKEVKHKQNDECKESDYSATVPTSCQKLKQTSMVSKQLALSVEKQTGSSKANLNSKSKKSIPLNTKRQVFQRDHACQWITAKTNQNGQIEHTQCSSRFQLQIDHKKPKWLDGGNEFENLQVLCAIHNKLKYQRQLIE